MNLRPSKEAISVAQWYHQLNRQWLINLLKSFTYISLFVFVASFFISYLGVVSLSGLGFLSLSLFTITFVILNLITGFLNSAAQKQSPASGPGDESIDNLLSFDALRCAGPLVLSTPNLAQFFANLRGTPRVQFMIEEMGLSPEKMVELDKSLPQQLADEHLLGYVFEEALNFAMTEGSQNLTSADIFYGFLKNLKNYPELCLEIQLTDNDIRNIAFWANRKYFNQENILSLADRLRVNTAGLGSDWSSGYTLALDRFSVDLTNKSLSNSYSVSGREDVIEEIEAALTNASKSSCLLVGPTGVGKTTLAYGLANKLFWGLSSETLNYKRVIKLDPQALSSYSSDRAQIQSALVAVLNDAVTAGNVILFIDEIQNLFTEKDTIGSINATEIIQPYLENNSVQIVGAITENDYETYIRPKTAIAGNFAVIKVTPTKADTTIKIMCDLAANFTARHHRKVTFGAIKEIHRLSERFESGKEMPARAIDMLLEIVSAKNITGDLITKDVVLSYYQASTKAPVARLDDESKTNLVNLESKIKTRLIGQETAVAAVVSSLKRALTQERDDTKPIGSFLFFGPTGVGKTELAKSLAWAYFGDEEDMIRMDMSQYKDTGSIRNFIGQKITGKNELEGGEFVKKIRQKPYSVVLLDEIEKADKEILDLFLQALDEGYINDGAGQRVSLSNTIIIATSNAGAHEIRDAVNAGESNFREKILDVIQRQGIFRPEFLNRFDGLILFNPLREEEVYRVAQLMIGKSLQGYLAKGYHFTIAEDLAKRIATEGYQPDLGARPLQRTIADRLENYIADRILDGTYQEGQSYNIGVSEIYPA